MFFVFIIISWNFCYFNPFYYMIKIKLYDCQHFTFLWLDGNFLIFIFLGKETNIMLWPIPYLLHFFHAGLDIVGYYYLRLNSRWNSIILQTIQFNCVLRRVLHQQLELCSAVEVQKRKTPVHLLIKTQPLLEAIIQLVIITHF